MNGLATVADSMSNINNLNKKEEIVDFLNRKADILEFDALVLIDEQGHYISSTMKDSKIQIDAKELMSMPSVQESFHNKVTTNDLKGKQTYYCMPVYTNEEITHVLIGMRTQEVMQSMISSKVFDGQGLSCIIDSQGNMVLSPTEVSPFMQLEDIFDSQENKKFVEDIEEMEKRMDKGQDGIIEFRSIKGEDLFLSYNSLNINDWYLLTLIPSNLISSNTDAYIFKYSLIVAATSLSFVALLLMLHRIYRENNKQLQYIAFTDEVTGGINNSAFQFQYQKLSHHEPFTYAIILLDMKDFKLINEKYGIQQANDVLRYLYNIIEKHLRKEDDEFVGRGESDHFFICMKESQMTHIQKRIDEMIDDINSFQDIDISYHQFTFRQGAYLIENPQEEITILQDRARMAIRSRYTDQKNQCSFYDSSLIEKLKNDNELYSLFDESLKNHDFEVYLQPKVSLKNLKVEGAEALVRWNHPQKDKIFPSDFIPLFERGGQICLLDLYVFKQACQFIQKWNQDHQSQLLISVNISREHFKNDSFLDKFAKIAQKYKIPQNTIEFELTESLFFERNEIDKVKRIIHQMHELGFQCSLDDFGFGYSSLALLNELEIDTFKFDRSFFLNMNNRKSKDIIETLVELAKKLQVKTVAEGIEEQEQMEYLKSIDCDQIQGYIFSKPLPMKEFVKWVKNFHC